MMLQCRMRFLLPAGLLSLMLLACAATNESEGAGSDGTNEDELRAQGWICDGGLASECNGADERWTGTKCCVQGASQCVDGLASECNGADERWTGTECCVLGAELCVDGLASECNGADERWTGTQCCLMGAQ